MKLIGVVTAGLLGTLVVAEGAYIVKTRQEMDDLRQRLDAVTSEGGSARAAAPRFGETSEGDRDEAADDPSGGRAAQRLPPPRFVPTGTPAPAPSNDPLPMPPGFDSAESREQLRQFVVAQMQRQRDEERQARQQQREEEIAKARETVAKALGLSADQHKQLADVVASNQNHFRELRDKAQQGQIPREQMREQFQAMRTKTESDMQRVLGTDGMQKLDALRRENPDVVRTAGLGGGGGRDRGGGGGPPWGGGGPGQQGQPGQGNGQGQPGPAARPGP